MSCNNLNSSSKRASTKNLCGGRGWGKGRKGRGENPLKNDICDKIYPDGLYQRSGGCVLQIFYKKYLEIQCLKRAYFSFDFDWWYSIDLDIAC